MLSFNPASSDQALNYNLLYGGIAPRPIALVSTLSKGGGLNLAPFSSVQALSSAPPFISLSFAKKPSGEEKDTLTNILDTKEFVANSVHPSILDRVVESAADYPSNVSEFSLGFTPVESAVVKPPRVAESKFQLECILHSTTILGNATLVIAEVKMIHIDEAAFEGGRVNSEALNLVGRLGGPKFSSVGEVWLKKVPIL